MPSFTNALQEKLHVSWLIAWSAAGVIIGIAWAGQTGPVLSEIQLYIIAAVLLAIAFGKRLKMMVILAIAAGMALGFARGISSAVALQDYRPYYGEVVSLKGVVSEDTVTDSSGNQRILLRNVSIDGMVLPGTVWVSTNAAADIKRSDILQFEGVLHEGFGTIPASMFRARLADAERPVRGDLAREARDWFAAGVRKAIAEPEASLGIGFLTGQRSTLPEDLDAQLKLLGLTHVVVASGYNLTILVRFTRRLFARYSKYLAFATAAAMIAAFVMVTGFSPSMSRAALVTGVSLMAWYFGRNVQPLVILPFSAAVTALVNPAYVWGDIGWYLSFASFAGIMILAPLVKHYFWGEHKELPATGRVALETMSAQLATLPIIALIFGQYSPFALPANVLLLPFIPLAMLLTFTGGLAGVALPQFASLFGLPAELLLRYMTTVTDYMSRLPGAAAELHFTPLIFVASYAVLFVTLVVLWRKTRHNFGRDNIVE